MTVTSLFCVQKAFSASPPSSSPIRRKPPEPEHRSHKRPHGIYPIMFFTQFFEHRQTVTFVSAPVLPASSIPCCSLKTLFLPLLVKKSTRLSSKGTSCWNVSIAISFPTVFRKEKTGLPWDERLRPSTLTPPATHKKISFNRLNLFYLYRHQGKKRTEIDL